MRIRCLILWQLHPPAGRLRCPVDTHHPTELRDPVVQAVPSTQPEQGFALSALGLALQLDVPIAHLPGRLP